MVWRGQFRRSRVGVSVLGIIGATAMMGISPAIANAGPPTPPSVTKQPVSRTVNVGHTARLSAKASGTPTPTVQWEVSTDGVTFVDVAGATSRTLKFTPTAGQSGDQYEAVFSNASGTATTAPAALYVTIAPGNVACTSAEGGDEPGPYTSPPPFSNPYFPFALGGCNDSLDGGNVTFTNYMSPPTVENTASVEWANQSTTTFDYTAISTSSPRCEPRPGDEYFDEGAFLITGEVTGNSGGSTVTGPIKALVCIEQDTVGTPQVVSYDLPRGTKFHL